MARDINLSFAGCGFLGIYHVGVAICFKRFAAPQLLARISGASVGSLAACYLLCGMPLEAITKEFFRVVQKARRHLLGPCSMRFNIQTCLLKGLRKSLPADAHERVNDKLHISLTRIYDGKNVIVSEFSSREDLLKALLCACFIPLFSGCVPPRFHGVRYMDGGFSDNLPILDGNTITVSPFCGESDICPRDRSSQMFHINWANTSIEVSIQNLNRLGRILFPPHPEMLYSFCQQGFDDALDFLRRKKLFSCTQCISVLSNSTLGDQVPRKYNTDCIHCKKYNEEQKNDQNPTMPDTVLSVIQVCIDEANEELKNWGVRLFAVLLCTVTMPTGIMVTTLVQLLGATSMIGRQLLSVGGFVLHTLDAIMHW